jgi:hypothetical protein
MVAQATSSSPLDFWPKYDPAMTTVWKSCAPRFRKALLDYKARTKKTDAEIAADIGGITRQIIGHWAKGIRTPELDNLFRACAAIGADPMLILFDVPAPRSKPDELDTGMRRTMIDVPIDPTDHLSNEIHHATTRRRKDGSR